MADARSHGLRARDTDRVDACTLLDSAHVAGELTDGEHADRTAKALAAKTFGELDAVLEDLQIPANLVNSPVVRPRRRGPSTRWKVAAAIVLAAALLGAFAGCVSRVAAPKPDLPDPTTGQGLASFVEAYKGPLRRHQGRRDHPVPHLCGDRAAAGRPGRGARRVLPLRRQFPHHRRCSPVAGHRYHRPVGPGSEEDRGPARGGPAVGGRPERPDQPRHHRARQGRRSDGDRVRRRRSQERLLHGHRHR
ncbi:DUF1707 domain-containing protein [Nocardia tengchongensis]|uniref:DUF1707 domain-containing protein n=1 Tax=Nocardia tengchongensis TaxID=2055889 RepID=A0ABX8CSR3_9NOCA|nr:DUF1707 domain-containing protein [Nocardia tengchongensis]